MRDRSGGACGKHRCPGRIPKALEEFDDLQSFFPIQPPANNALSRFARCNVSEPVAGVRVAVLAGLEQLTLVLGSGFGAIIVRYRQPEVFRIIPSETHEEFIATPIGGRIILPDGLQELVDTRD